MRATWVLLLLAILAPPAQAALCIGGACVADQSYRDPSAGCNGTWHVTGVWLVAPDVYLYAMGERRDCANGWSGMGGSGLRIGLVLAGQEAEARWYSHARGGCELGAEVARFYAGGPCPLPPPALPWGNALP